MSFTSWIAEVRSQLWSGVDLNGVSSVCICKSVDVQESGVLEPSSAFLSLCLTFSSHSEGSGLVLLWFLALAFYFTWFS